MIGSRLRRKVMDVSDTEAMRFVRGTGHKWDILKHAVGSAIRGYQAVLDDHRHRHLIPTLDKVESPLRGYAYEGAAMGLTCLDLFSLRGNKFSDYLQGPAADHAYMVHIGAGEALARLHRNPEPFLRRLPHPVLRWLVMDGFGFHEGFFRPAAHVVSQRIPQKLSLYARRVFDQGLGRSFYFSCGAEVDEVSSIVSTFHPGRHRDLWLGVGVGAGYVGGLSFPEVERLRDLAGPYAIQLGIGAAFVAKGRLCAGNLIEETDIAARSLCDRPAEQAAQLVDEAFAALEGTTSACAYDLLQNHIGQRLCLPGGRSVVCADDSTGDQLAQA